jgi:hypothetical protein
MTQGINHGEFIKRSDLQIECLILRYIPGPPGLSGGDVGFEIALEIHLEVGNRTY